jgi:uncharacterized protein YqhQ
MSLYTMIKNFFVSLSYLDIIDLLVGCFVFLILPVFVLEAFKNQGRRKKHP